MGQKCYAKQVNRACSLQWLGSHAIKRPPTDDGHLPLGVRLSARLSILDRRAR